MTQMTPTSRMTPMTQSIKLIRWSDQYHAEARASFLERFKRCGHALRPDPCRQYTPGEEYTDLVLRLAVAGPSELVVAERRGRDVARAAVMRCSTREGTGVVGLYEAAEGREGDLATERILEVALEWAADEGIQELFAPVDANTWFSYRFAVPSKDPKSDRPPYRWEPSQPAAYLKRFRRLGFEDAEFYETRGLHFPVAGPYGVQDVLRYTAPALEEARHNGFHFHRLKDQADAVPYDELHHLCNDAFKDNPLFEALSADVFCGLYASALTGAAADFTHWVRDSEGHLRGFVMAFSDDDEVVIKSIAVDPVTRGRRLSTALIHLVLEGAQERGITAIISALVRKGNTSEFLSKPHLMPGVATWTREYVLLRKVLSK